MSHPVKLILDFKKSQIINPYSVSYARPLNPSVLFSDIGTQPVKVFLCGEESVTHLHSAFKKKDKKSPDPLDIRNCLLWP